VIFWKRLRFVSDFADDSKLCGRFFAVSLRFPAELQSERRKPLSKTKSDPEKPVQIFLAKVAAAAENLPPPVRLELQTAARICRAEMRKGNNSPWRRFVDARRS